MQRQPARDVAVCNLERATEGGRAPHGGRRQGGIDQPWKPQDKLERSAKLQGFDVDPEWASPCWAISNRSEYVVDRSRTGDDQRPIGEERGDLACACLEQWSAVGGGACGCALQHGLGGARGECGQQHPTASVPLFVAEDGRHGEGQVDKRACLPDRPQHLGHDRRRTSAAEEIGELVSGDG